MASFFETAIAGRLEALERSLNLNAEFAISARNVDVRFSCLAKEGTNDERDSSLLIDVENGRASVSCHAGTVLCSFALSASTEHWSQMLRPRPVPPFQSYWGVLRTFSDDQSCGVVGDRQAFSRYARFWRLALDELRQAATPFDEKALDETPTESNEQDFDEDDHITGKYVWITASEWGRTKIFYETAGSGSQNVLFLHTAGSDGRQYHEVMNDASLRKTCTMYTFDLPGHGRSYPGSLQLPEGHLNTETRYVETIGAFLRAKSLSDVIVSGASMGGHVCLALAMRASEMGILGVVPCEASAHMPFTQPTHETGNVTNNEAIINPERVCGMIGPSATMSRRKLIWWSYSSQAVGIFQGDLAFYFNGWDGRSRLSTIDTKKCPVYMLTGEYDYSCTPDNSSRTAASIPGAKFEKMVGVGHFPATEDPALFVSYFQRALAHIQGV